MVVISVIIAVVLFIGVRSLAVMWLWNAILPSLLHVPDISFLQALGLSILVPLIIGNIIDTGILNSIEKNDNSKAQ